MFKKLSLVTLPVLLALWLLTLTSASSPPEPPVPRPPVSWTGVPAEGPLTPEEIKKLSPPPTDTSALDKQFKAELARIEAEAAAKGLKVPAVPTEELEAGVALQESLTDEQREAIAEVFSRHEKALKALMAPVEAGLKSKAKPEGAPSLEEARELESRLQAWQVALDADIEKVLTEQQFAQYLASRPTVPELDVSRADLAALSLEVPSMAYTASPPDEVLAAAEKELPAFLKAIPSSELAQHGFNSADEVAEATLGEPYEVFTMIPEAIKAYRAGTRLSALLTKTNTWYFPVMVGGEPRTILTVALVEGEWEAVDIGGLELPKNLDRADKALPGLMATRVKGDYTAKFVRVFQLYADFMAVESADGDYLVPIMMNPEAIGVENLKLYTLDEVLPKLGAAVEKIIQLDKDVTDDTLGGGSPDIWYTPSSNP
ncbi:MAG: hypothetical protein ACE5I2_09770 [Anaerolineae bacterium]